MKRQLTVDIFNSRRKLKAVVRGRYQLVLFGYYFEQRDQEQIEYDQPIGAVRAHDRFHHVQALVEPVIRLRGYRIPEVDDVDDAVVRVRGRFLAAEPAVEH